MKLDKIDISNKKILFLGYGGVAKCTLNYMNNYFDVNDENIYLVDKSVDAIYGPNLEKINKKNIINLRINSSNFNKLVNDIQLSENDIIIDLTFCSDTYYFVKQSLLLGFNYINTSIEDENDMSNGTSIDLQQKIIRDIYQTYLENNEIKSNILIEFGQNPGLIQHYILNGLNEMNKIYNNNDEDNFSQEAMIDVVKKYNVGTIFCSEIDNMILKDEEDYNNSKGDVIYNTWSVGGMICETKDYTELVHGLGNKNIKPIIPTKYINYSKMKYIPKYENQEYEVIFLHEIGHNNTLNTICPIIDDNDNIQYINFDGRLIHHGEMFEMAKYFGKDAPFMTYVYKVNKYAEESFKNYFNKNPENNFDDLKQLVKKDNDSFNVLDNINKEDKNHIIGYDTIGGTIYCGKEKVDRIFWCGSILADTHKNVDSNFTPTIVQVAAGVLSGLSYIMEDNNKNKGLHWPCDLDTKYILNKSKPLLGKVFFTEIPVDQFSGKFIYKTW
jgi:homospermidine synthase